MSDGTLEQTPFKFFEGWLQHKGKEENHTTTQSLSRPVKPNSKLINFLDRYSNYKDLWMVLKDGIIYIFIDSNVGKDTHIGKLTIDKYTEVHKKGGDDRSGYKFELFTGYGQTRKRNKFRSQKKVVMEMWRGYLVGLAQGTAPSDLDLLPDQVTQIQSDIDYYRSRPKNPSVGSMNNAEKRMSRLSGADSGIVDSVSVRTSSTGRTLGGGSDGGPTMRHKFTNDHFANDKVPSWFFENCSRQQAEIILKTQKCGNTLMRMSSTHKDHGSYVISKYFRKENKFEHFEVLRVANGYRINVENQHNAMSNLMEVMNFFVKTAGRSDTYPLTSNRLTDYGLQDEPDYATRFFHAQSDMQRSSINLSTSDPDEPPPDYEEPAKIQPIKTYTPGILKKEGSKFYSRQYTSPGMAPTSQQFSTVSHGSRSSSQHSSVPAPQDFQGRVDAAARLKDLDDVIDAFEPPAQEEEYVNKDFFNQVRTGYFVEDQRGTDSTSPPPPPPHLPHSHVNEDNKSVLSMPLPPTPHINNTGSTTVPPPPPPPPAPPLIPSFDVTETRKSSRSKSVPNIGEHLAGMQLKHVGSDLHKTVQGDLPKSVFRPSQRVQNPSTPKQAARPKSLANQSSTPELSSSAPRFPTSPLKLRQVSSPATTVSPPPVMDTTPEIDETALSPVDDIRKKFECRRSSVPATSSKSPGSGKSLNSNMSNQSNQGFIHSSNNQSAVIAPPPSCMDNTVEDYYCNVADEYYNDITNLKLDDDECYDNTQGQEGQGGHVTNVLAGKTSPINKQDMRVRFTTEQKPRPLSECNISSRPELEDGIDDGTLNKGEMLAFRQQLEKVIGGQKTTPVKRQTSYPNIQAPMEVQGQDAPPRPPSLRSVRGSLPPTPLDQFEQEYEELPENSIPPDNSNA